MPSYFKPLVQWLVRHWLPISALWARAGGEGSAVHARCGAFSPHARSWQGMPPARGMGSRRDKAPPEAGAPRKARAPGGWLAVVGASVALVAAAALQHLGRRPPVDTVPRVDFWSVDSDRQLQEARTETAAAEVIRRVAAGRRPVVLTGSPVREWRAIRDGAWSPDRHTA